VKVGDGRQVLCKKVGPAVIEWEDQDYANYVYIMPGPDKPIMGVLAMEALDVKPNPVTRQVERAHTDEEINILY
jgi:predicted aspartyl protease